MRWCALCLTSPDVNGRLDDVTKFVRQVILTPHRVTINCYTGANREGGGGTDRTVSSFDGLRLAGLHVPARL
jgi:hypothetical protein